AISAKGSSEQLGRLGELRSERSTDGGAGRQQSFLDARKERLEMTSRAAESPGGAAEDANHGDIEIEGHHTLQHSCYKGAGKFRLRARAFTMTRNSLALVLPPRRRGDFLVFVKGRAETYNNPGRIHHRAYFSWHGRSSGIDHSTTNEWVYAGARPRVDANTENRGPSEWLRATRRGHFYAWAWKSGTVYAETKYAPWEGLWAPEAWREASLWRMHKLDHDAYRQLSAKLRDGHDRRMACLEAVVATVTGHACKAEQSAALAAIQARAKPMKPLCAAVESWMMHLGEVDDWYKSLVLHGPSRTGKSRLARSLFGAEKTLVVDAMNAHEPNLHAHRRGAHRAALLDEMQGPDFITRTKKLLQMHIDGAELGKSPTMQRAYHVFVWRTPIVSKTNHCALEGLNAAGREWAEANCVAVEISEPVWEVTPSAEAAAQGEASAPRNVG
ncbi:unnamed protein product, partial [Prorocentrum cordatum]